MARKIITISRQFGSGGHTVGQLVAQKLGVPLYDKALVEKVAEESGFVPKFVEDNSEHAPSKSIFSYAFAPQGIPGIMNGMSTGDYLWHIQCKTILKLADEGPCVIVGRNSDYVLKDRKDCLHVFIYADMETKAKRVLERYGKTDKKVETRITEKDKRRSVNYQHYTGRIWGAAENYDICLNTGLLSLEDAADIIVEVAKK